MAPDGGHWMEIGHAGPQRRIHVQPDALIGHECLVDIARLRMEPEESLQSLERTHGEKHISKPPAFGACAASAIMLPWRMARALSVKKGWDSSIAGMHDVRRFVEVLLMTEVLGDRPRAAAGVARIDHLDFVAGHSAWMVAASSHFGSTMIARDFGVRISGVVWP